MEQSLRIDVDRLREMAAGCGFSLAELVEFYAPRAKAELSEVRAAARAGQVEDLARLAHGAAGSSATIGLTSLSACYREVLALARGGTAPGIDEALDGTARHVDAALAELTRLAQDAP